MKIAHTITVCSIPALLLVVAYGFAQEKAKEPLEVTKESRQGGDEAGDVSDVSAQGTDEESSPSGAAVGYPGYGGGFGAPGAGYGEAGFGAGATFGGVTRLNQRLIQGKNIMISWSKDNDELRGFSHTSGEWSNLKIEKQETLNPIVGMDVAAVRVGDTMAAYSGTTGTWDVLILTEGSKAIATIGVSVQTTDNDYLYTFAASKGKWTSPNDPNFRRSTNSDAFGTPGGADPYGSTAGSGYVAPGPAVSGPGPGMFGQSKQSQFDQLALKLAQQWRGKGLDNVEARTQLSQAVSQAFDQRLKQQKSEAAKLQEKLKKIQDAIESREALRERIIERRVDELLDPNVDWDSPSSSTKSGANTGTPIGLPGPPRLPLGSPAGLSAN